MWILGGGFALWTYFAKPRLKREPGARPFPPLASARLAVLALAGSRTGAVIAGFLRWGGPCLDGWHGYSRRLECHREWLSGGTRRDPARYFLTVAGELVHRKRPGHDIAAVIKVLCLHE